MLLLYIIYKNNQIEEMLKHNELRKGKIIILGDDPYEIMQYSHVVKGRGKSIVQTQLRNLRTSSVLQKTFHPGDELEEAVLENEDVVFAYSNRGKYVFHRENNPADRFELSEELIENKQNYLKEKTLVTVIFFDEKIIGVSLPVKMNLKVIEAPPGVKGNRVDAGTKVVTLETGKKLNAPLFIKEGDIIEVNTETGEYVRRIND